jgi:hypothetical protein
MSSMRSLTASIPFGSPRVGTRKATTASTASGDDLGLRATRVICSKTSGVESGFRPRGLTDTNQPSRLGSPQPPFIRPLMSQAGAVWALIVNEPARSSLKVRRSPPTRPRSPAVGTNCDSSCAVSRLVGSRPMVNPCSNTTRPSGSGKRSCQRRTA